MRRRRLPARRRAALRLRRPHDRHRGGQRRRGRGGQRRRQGRRGRQRGRRQRGLRGGRGGGRAGRRLGGLLDDAAGQRLVLGGPRRVGRQHAEVLAAVPGSGPRVDGGLHRQDDEDEVGGERRGRLHLHGAAGLGGGGRLAAGRVLSSLEALRHSWASSPRRTRVKVLRDWTGGR